MEKCPSGLSALAIGDRHRQGIMGIALKGRDQKGFKNLDIVSEQAGDSTGRSPRGSDFLFIANLAF